MWSNESDPDGGEPLPSYTEIIFSITSFCLAQPSLIVPLHSTGAEEYIWIHRFLRASAQDLNADLF